MALPRADVKAGLLLVQGAAWDAAMDGIESADRISVAAPLQISKTPSGKVISLLEQPRVRFRISSIVSSQIGRYNAKTYSDQLKPAATGALAATDLGTISTPDNAIVWHVPEIALGSAKHMLKSDVDYVGRVSGMTSAGKYLIAIGVLPIGETASPLAISGGSGATLRSTTWSRVADGTPVNIARFRYYCDGSGVLQQVQWTEAYDSCGLLISVSAES
jgi:hypothetical protein